MRRLIAGVALAATATGACSVQTLGAPKGDLTVYAVFDDVQNLVIGHSVQLADVRIGTVTGIRLDGYRARVAMSIADGRRLPAGTSASVAKTSLLGENYVRLDPPRGADLRAGPFLASGAVITRTSTRPDLEQVTERVAPILAAAGGQDLGDVVDSLSTATRGKGAQLNRIVARAAEISDAYAAAGRDLVKVIDGLGRLGDSLERGGAELDRLPSMVLLATDRVRKDRAELKRAVQELVELAGSFNERIGSRHAPRLRGLLLRLDSLLGSMTRGKDQLKAFVDVINEGFLKAPSLTYDGQALIHTWLAGFLPAATEPARTLPPDAQRELRRLLAPR